MYSKRNAVVGLREAAYKPNFKTVAIIVAIIVLFVIVFAQSINNNKVHETYTEYHFEQVEGKVYGHEYTVERTYPVVQKAEKPIETIEAVEAIIEATVEPEETRHFPESTYIKGAIMLEGEAGGVKSLTEQSGCLWVACNRVDSSDPFFPDDLESVIEQACQFYGYTPSGEYSKESYDLAVDVFERWYRECNGETASEVGRTLPADYLYFTGDGEHNYFTKVQNGTPYEWGSQLISPYRS